MLVLERDVFEDDQARRRAFEGADIRLAVERAPEFRLNDFFQELPSRRRVKQPDPGDNDCRHQRRCDHPAYGEDSFHQNGCPNAI